MSGKIKHYTIDIYKWVAQWVEYKEIDGLIRRIGITKGFSVKKYGFEEAKELACRCRNEAVNMLNRPDAIERRESWLINPAIRWKKGIK